MTYDLGYKGSLTQFLRYIYYWVRQISLNLKVRNHLMWYIFQWAGEEYSFSSSFLPISLLLNIGSTCSNMYLHFRTVLASFYILVKG